MPVKTPEHLLPHDPDPTRITVARTPTGDRTDPASDAHREPIDRRPLALHLLGALELGFAATLRLLEANPEAACPAALELPADATPLLRTRLDRALGDWSREQRLEELAAWETQGIRCLLPDQAEFPRPLRDSPHCPPLLFVRGTLEAEPAERAVGFVGTRRCTDYGIRACRHLVEQLVPLDPVILSGLAQGIDRAAHRTALAVGLRTWAVPGGGLLHRGDREGHLLGQAIVAAGGALLSPFPPELTPRKWSFPFRNRILSGLACGVVVVESRTQGGALLTAQAALDEGKMVVAVPGSIFSSASAGCHALLAEGAAPVCSGGDIAGALGLGTLLPMMTGTGRKRGEGEWQTAGGADSALDPLASPLREPATADNSQADHRARTPEQKLLGLLRREPAGVVELATQAQMEPAEAIAILTLLELRGWARSLPGGRYAREI
jgi:DNA processing protein